MLLARSNLFKHLETRDTRRLNCIVKAIVETHLCDFQRRGFVKKWKEGTGESIWVRVKGPRNVSSTLFGNVCARLRVARHPGTAGDRVSCFQRNSRKVAVVQLMQYIRHLLCRCLGWIRLRSGGTLQFSFSGLSPAADIVPLPPILRHRSTRTVIDGNPNRTLLLDRDKPLLYFVNNFLHVLFNGSSNLWILQSFNIYVSEFIDFLIYGFQFFSFWVSKFNNF